MPEYTKDELFDLIVSNPAAYEDYRKEHEEIDLSELDFSNLTLEGIDLTNADLSGCSFGESHFTEVNFTDTDLTSADFSRANLVECNFSGALLNGTDFSYAAVNYCSFTEADMAGAVFNETDLQNSDFSAADNMDAVRFDESTLWPALFLVSVWKGFPYVTVMLLAGLQGIPGDLYEAAAIDGYPAAKERNNAVFLYGQNTIGELHSVSGRKQGICYINGSTGQYRHPIIAGNQEGVSFHLNRAVIR